MSKFIHKTVRLFFITLLAIIMYCLARTFVAAFMNYQWYSYIVAILFVAVTLFVMIISAKKADKIYSCISNLIGSLSTKKLVLILCAVSLALKIGGVLIFNCNCNLHPDMQKYISFANQIAHTGKITEGTNYAIDHSYTSVFGAFLSPIGLVFGDNPIGYTLFMCIINTITVLLLFDIIRKFTGNTTAFVGLLIYNLLPMGFFQTQVVIHETALLFFHILSFWFLQKGFETTRKLYTRIICFAFSFISIAFGTSINQAGTIAVISFAIYSFIKALEFNKEKVKSAVKRFAKNSLMFLLILIISASALWGSNFIKESCVKIFVGSDTPTNTIELTYGWSLYLGANYEESGAWNKEDYDTYFHYKEIEDADEAIEYQRNLIKERYMEYLKNPQRIPIHIYRKISVLWSPYFAFRYVPDNPMYKTIASVAGGMIRLFCISATLVSFSAFHLMTVIGLFRKKSQNKSYATPELHFMMFVIGLTMLLLLMEVAAKYSSHSQILLFAIGMINFNSYRKNILKLKSKLSR